MTLHDRINSFIALGKRIKQLTPEEFDELARKVENHNNWFTPDQTRFALNHLEEILQERSLVQWLKRYPLSDDIDPKKVGIMMAGNIPAVGFHDLMTVLLSGHDAHVKLSSSDRVLIKWLVRELITMNPAFANKVFFEDFLKNKDAYIATGSDNSARYFDYYFGKYPSIIRKNRTSVAVLDGSETKRDFQDLARDVFQYFGLGCRNVSKFYVKDPDQIKEFLDAIEGVQPLLSHHKYLNNYEYNKSIYLVNREKHLDNGFLLCKESKELVSPIAVLYYEVYQDEASLKSKLEDNRDKIQCMVSNGAWLKGSVAFGQAQKPGVEDYADHVDTMEFLLSL
ncbi:acyl-CoA reductase [Echinicola jeungdonensis]|uniref:Acyl-CoA reductase n=1 Tax=Echinicola jeungdonensis TaxID=709343 RepID=A0ABV5JBD0_9BACT|nr:acyl-CoA reductase [Echinicola jeungdonensis]MDN3670276.1 acyl-CoA reductase [Echinicola jeungdonensis]